MFLFDFQAAAGDTPQSSVIIAQLWVDVGAVDKDWLWSDGSQCCRQQDRDMTATSTKTKLCSQSDEFSVVQYSQATYLCALSAKGTSGRKRSAA